MTLLLQMAEQIWPYILTEDTIGSITLEEQKEQRRIMKYGTGIVMMRVIAVFQLPFFWELTLIC
jgi:hypothetical protein